MTTLTCDLCETAVAGESFEQWMQNLMPHYMQAHPEVMKDPNKTKEDQQKWMAENKARFDKAAKS